MNFAKNSIINNVWMRNFKIYFLTLVSFFAGLAFTVFAAPQVPTGLSASSVVDSKVILSWKTELGLDYQVVRTDYNNREPDEISPRVPLCKGADIATSTCFIYSDVESISISFVEPGVIHILPSASTKYYYRIRSVTSTGVTSDWSSVVSPATPPVLIPPQISVISPALNQQF